MTAFLYHNLSSHSRTTSAKTTSTKPDLYISTNFEFNKPSTGIQGSGKYTDNRFKSSLRGDVPSPSMFKRNIQAKTSVSTPTVASTAECLSARNPKAMFSATITGGNLKLSARADVTNAALLEIKAKENNVMRLKNAPRSQIITKTKLRTQGRVLKELNREWTSYRVKNSGYTPQCSSLPTEIDSFASEVTHIVPMDINQQLRNIFKSGKEEKREDKDISVTIPEEQTEFEHLKMQNKNKPYVSRQKQLKSFNKL